MAELFRYAAFISYSSKDARFAQRLHQALESYGIPSSLGKFDLIGGGKANRIYPVFRDREELSAGHLGEQIEANLKAAAALIVICSPNSAASPWVQKEIEFFVELGRRDKIFAIIPDDAPLTDESGVDCTQTCFPPAFRGDALQGDALEPLAADARKGKDGFRNAWLKIVAGMIGVTPGQIIDRDRRQRQRQFIVAASGVAALAVIALGATAWVDTQTWRANLSAYSERLTGDGQRSEATVFAIAGGQTSGAFLPARSDSSDANLRRLGAVQLRRVLGNLGDTALLHVSHNGSRLVAVSASGDVAHYDLTANTAGRPLGNLGTLDFVALWRDGSAMLTITADGSGYGGEARFHDLNSNSPPRVLGRMLGGILSSDGSMAVLVDPDRNITRFDLAAGHEGLSVGSLGANVIFQTFLDHGSSLLTLEPEGTVTRYNLRGQPSVDAMFRFGQRPARFIAAPNGTVFAMESASQQVAYCDIVERACRSLGRPYRFTNLTWNGAVVIVEDGNRNYTMHDTRTGATHSLGQLTNVVSRDGTLVVVTESMDGAYTYYDTEADVVVARPLPIVDASPGSFFLSDFISPDGIWLVSKIPAEVGEPRVWLRNLVVGGEPIDLGQVSNWTFSTDGRRLVTGGVDLPLTHYELREDGTATRLGDLGRGYFAEFSGINSILRVRHTNNTFTIYDLEPAAGDLRNLENEQRLSGADLNRSVCAANGDAYPPFTADIRQGDSQPALAASLRGRPWNPCDWRGLAGGSEGWSQWWRRVEVAVFGRRERDYKCGEINAAGDVRARRVESCRLAGVPDELIAVLPN